MTTLLRPGGCKKSYQRGYYGPSSIPHSREISSLGMTQLDLGSSTSEYFTEGDG